MRPVVAEWLAAQGLSPWLAPDYLVMGGIAGLVAGWVILRYASATERTGYARALAAAYVAAYAGGTLFELLRSLPAWLSGDGELSFGRAAWGGLFGAVLAAWWVVRAHQLDTRVFFDRVAVGVGLIFGFVRIGCFLGGCDYGRPSAVAWAMRFPHGSLAAQAHAELGWIAHGAESLAVHPTQLYEALFGFLSAAVLALLLRKRALAGQLLSVWIVLYATFRFCNELVRGDADRGMAFGMSTGQIVAVTVVCGLLAWRLRPWLITSSPAPQASSPPP
jgi:prolipoprotein diacylglyceryltransferase